jgi:glucose/arabinose dehydrogenase
VSDQLQVKPHEEAGPRETGGKYAPLLPDWLAYVYAPIIPYLKKIKITRTGKRDHQPQDILLPEGYVAEVVATEFNAPVHCCWDDQGNCYVIEAGHKIDSPPQIIKVDTQTGRKEVVFTVPESQWVKTGAVTGACWHAGYLYFGNTDKLCRVRPGSQEVEVIVEGLPGRGDHQTNYPVVGPDGRIYWGQGSVTNTGVVGPDNFAYEWLAENPGACEIPGQDIRLVGQNFAAQNVLGNETETVYTGAYVPFGTEVQPGWVIPGSNKPSGAVMRCNPDGTNVEWVAWGLRNPYGIAFSDDGRLFCTEHGMDERSARYVLDDPDDFYEIKEGIWYGWPDYASGVRLDNPYWRGGHNREPVIANPPNTNPPKPFASLQTHVGANGLDFCRDEFFGFKGDAFIALFGDLTPITSITKVPTPAGFKVIRVDMQTGKVYDFAVNKIQGPASLLPHDGFERPSHCAFGPDGALYVVDWGRIVIAPERGGIRMPTQTGTLWRIRRTDSDSGEEPPKPVVLPVEAIMYGVIAGAAAVTLGAVWWLFRRTRD